MSKGEWTAERRAAHGQKMRVTHAARKAAGQPIGFGAAPECLRREMASEGGKAAQARGTAHRWTVAEAAAAGRKGGIASRGGRGRLPESAS